MTKIPKSVLGRITSGIRSFQPIIRSAISRDINEADTALIVTDMLSSIFGYDKFSDITSEHGIQGAYCDLAIRLNGKTKVVIEIKAVGINLKDIHLRQGMSYATQEGCDWLILTNGSIWRFYKVLFSKPVDKELIAEIDFTQIKAKNTSILEIIFVFSKEGTVGDSLEKFIEKYEILSRFFVGAAILSTPTLNVIRKQLRAISPGVKVTPEQIKKVIIEEILKREVLEDEKSAVAQKKFLKATAASSRKTKKNITKEPIA